MTKYDVNPELMQNPNKAWEIGLNLSNQLKNNIDDYRFIWATASELQFKHVITRDTLKIAYS
tara:strand:+ start:300 stop:485 length:186 start_codon:yes stop_codon:yes gene_type:complete